MTTHPAEGTPPSSPSRQLRRPVAALLAAVLGLTATLALVVASPAPASAAEGTGTGPNGQTLTVSEVDGLDPGGSVVTVSGSGFTDAAGFDNDADGIYLALCVDNGVGQTPTPCLGGVDMSGESSSSRWITNSGIPGQPALTVPMGSDGTFTTTLSVSADDGTTDCFDLAEGKQCKIFTRADHRAGGDRSQDVRVPVTFSADAGGTVALDRSTGLDASGDTVVVSGSGFPTDGPGLYVVFGPVPEGNLTAAPFKPAAYVRSSSISEDGSWQVILSDIKARYTGADGVDYDFLAGGGHISTFRAQGQPDPDGLWATSTPVSFDVRTSDESFVTAALTDFLGEKPAPPEVEAGVAQLVAQGKPAYLRSLSTSDEWLSALVDRLYQDTLGRAGDETGTAYWVDQLRTGRQSVATVAANFYASPEYFDGIGGGTLETWIDDLYQKLLLRTSDAPGKAYWVGEVALKGRGNVAKRFYQSDESARTRVEALYQGLLGRSAEPAGLTYWAPRVVASGDIALAVFLAASPEYGTRAAVRFP